MANSSIEEEFERLRVHVENLKMSEKAKADFFQSKWNQLCEKEEKEKNRELELERLKLESEREKSEQKKLELELQEKEKERQAIYFKRRNDKQCFK